jgi:mono/diheme cytochrome c family protein
MREGVARDGSHLSPAFPYYAFTKLSDDDINALYAYLMTRPPVSSTTPANTIPWPLKIRPLYEGWKILFFRTGRFQPVSSKSAEWNRGAYLGNALSDCAGCHTPRNVLGAEESRHAYAGSLVEGWIAPALTDTNSSHASILHYLAGNREMAVTRTKDWLERLGLEEKVERDQARAQLISLERVH